MEPEFPISVRFENGEVEQYRHVPACRSGKIRELQGYKRNMKGVPLKW